MSYSFSARGATKQEVMQKVGIELDKVVVSQPIHSADFAQARAAAESFLDIIPDASESQDYYVSVSGSISWDGINPPVVKGASVNVGASLVAKEAAPV